MMSGNQVRELHSGDEVQWNDPDEGLCSKVLQIASIVVFDDGPNPMVRIEDKTGSTLECFASELS